MRVRFNTHPIKKNKKVFKKLLTNPKEYDIINTSNRERGNQNV